MDVLITRVLYIVCVLIAIRLIYGKGKELFI